MKKIKFILIGAGDRGTTYVRIGAECCPEFELVGVADPDPVRRDYIKNKFNLPESVCFSSWTQILEQPKFADVVIIGTQDKLHFEPAMKAISLGYHLLLEKPVAPTPEECLQVRDAALEKGVEVFVCHVLRFTPFFSLLKQIIDSGRIGDVMHIVHIEGVGPMLQAHSFVRGHWRKLEDSNPMILAKCCHDMDILQWLIGKRCLRVQSFGDLSYYRRENKPEGVPERCIDGCPIEASCPYSTIKLYKNRQKEGYVQAATHKHLPTDEDIMRTITETEYGKCVFCCENNVVDHQTVNLEYEGGVTVSLTMTAFSEHGRRLRIMGTKGELVADMGKDFVTVFDFETMKHTDIKIPNAVTNQDITGGHGGGDKGIMRTMCQYLTGNYQGNSVADIQTSIENHLPCFAAEESRLKNCVIDMDEYTKKLCLSYRK